MPMQVWLMWAHRQEFSYCSDVLTLDLGLCDDDKGHANGVMVKVGTSLGYLLLL